jgi:hypothetical protein
MLEMTTIAALVNSLKSATDIAKFIRESDLTIEKAEAKLKLAELVEALADAKLEAVEIQQSLHDKDSQIKKLTAELQRRRDMKWRQPCYFLENGEGVEEAFCQPCYDSQNLLVRLHGDGEGRYSCKVCKKIFVTEECRKKNQQALSAAVKSSRSNWMGGY